MSLFKFALAAAVAGAAVASPAGASRNLWMKGEQIAAAFRGATLHGAYAGGRSFSETYGVDGRVEYAEIGLSTGGRWSVTADTLCTIYDGDESGGCFRVAKVGENCFEFFFAARTEQMAPGPDGVEPKWTARGSVAGKDAGCPDRADV